MTRRGMVRPVNVEGARQRLPMSPRQQAWNAMRIFRVFSTGDILGTAEIARHNLRALLRALRRERYVVHHGQRGQRGQSGWAEIWRLAKNTGPLVPQITREGRLIDPNLAAQEEEG